MNELDNPLQNVLEAFDVERAQIAYQTLLSLLQAVHAEETAPVLAKLREKPETHIALLGQHPLMCNAIMDISGLGLHVANGRLSPNDIGVTHDIAALIYLLTLSYESHGAPDEILAVLDTAYPPLFNKFLQASSAQILTLCRYLIKIRDFFSKLAVSQSRIVLVELPIGNSLPVTILKSLLASLAPVEHLQVSLSRNDKSKSGITRKELLSERLRGIDLKPSDIVLYLDEWNSGVNFNILCKLQAQIIGGGAFFFPCAMLSQQASANPRYKSFCIDHDAYLKTWGCAGAEFRQEFTPIVSALSMEGEFFWAEKDRIAGWRKFQLHGSMFSSIDATIDILANDPDSLNEALALSLAEIAQSKPLPASPQEAFIMLRRFFFESYEAYKKCRDKLRLCAETMAAGGIIEDFGSALSELQELYQQAGLEEGPEKIAVGVALRFTKRMGPIDPADRYYFKNHAPIVAPLQGRMRRPHELTVEHIQSLLR